MAKVTLPPITSGYNLQRINDNFKKIEENINSESIQRSGNNNTMNQDLDMDGNKILNSRTDPDNPGSLVSVRDFHSMMGKYDIQQLQVVGDYKEGVVLSSYNQAVRTADGLLWQASVKAPLPYTLTGKGVPEDDNLILATDITLREELGSLEGYKLVGGLEEYVDVSTEESKWHSMESKRYSEMSKDSANTAKEIEGSIAEILTHSEIGLYDDVQVGFNKTPMDGFFSVYDEDGIVTTYQKVEATKYTKISSNKVSNVKFEPSESSSDFDAIKHNGWYRSPNTNNNFPGKPPQLASVGNLMLLHLEGLNGRATQICMNTTKSDNSTILFRSKGADMIYGDWKEMYSGDNSVPNKALALSQHTSNFDEIVDNGWYRSPNTNDDFPGKPPQLRTLGNLMLLHLQGLGLRATQICMNTTGADNAVMLFRSKGSAGVYGDWSTSSSNITLESTIDKEVFVDGGVVKHDRERSDFYTLPYNSIYTTSVDLNNHYKKLVEDFPDYVSESLLGRDDFGNEIWEFTFAAKGFRYAAPATLTNNAHPKFVVVSGTHGSERAAAVSSLCFFDDLCRKWQQDERLADLRWGAEIVVIACLNPWGVNNGNKRRNGNDVDFNHNFPNGWNELTSEYKGPRPLSEPETIIANSLPSRHPTANVFIDFHGHENNYLTWIGTRSVDGFSTQKHTLRKHGSWVYRNFLRNNPNTSLMASTGTTATGLATAWTLAGKQGFLLECGIQWSGFGSSKIRMIGVDALTTLIYESWLKESENTGWISEPPKEGIYD